MGATRVLVSACVPLFLPQEFMKRLEEKRAALNKATSMGDAILAICHPDSITTIKHWITIIRARFEEVSAPRAMRRAAGAEGVRVRGCAHLGN